VAIRKSDYDDRVYQKVCSQIIKRALDDARRYLFFQFPRQAPLVLPWEIDLLKLKIIQPDKHGNVRYAAGERIKTMKASDLLKDERGGDEKGKTKDGGITEGAQGSMETTQGKN